MNRLILTLIIFSLFACGPSKEEREQEILDQTVLIENLEMEVRGLATDVDDEQAKIKKLKNTLSLLK